MRESIGYTVSLNIAIMFIIIVFGFLSAIVIYFRSNKVANVITSSIEKYSGYNSYSKTEINNKLTSIGYNRNNYKCAGSVSDREAKDDTCSLADNDLKNNPNGYCVYLCYDKDGDYYYYKIRTNMMINVPLINDLLDIGIYTNTNRLYDFEKNLG